MYGTIFTYFASIEVGLFFHTGAFSNLLISKHHPLWLLPIDLPKYTRLCEIVRPHQLHQHFVHRSSCPFKLLSPRRLTPCSFYLFSYRKVLLTLNLPVNIYGDYSCTLFCNSSVFPWMIFAQKLTLIPTTREDEELYPLLQELLSLANS